MKSLLTNSLAIASLAVVLLGGAASAREYIERTYTGPVDAYGDMYAPAYTQTTVIRDRESGVEKAGKGVVGLGDRSTKTSLGVAGKAAKTVLGAF
ncbi:MAG TPA: hypothetical protein V6C86_09840 [Oculatellaceae cyanobacterium]